MGLVYAEIELINGADWVLSQEGLREEKNIRRMDIRAMVDSGAYMLAINETIKAQLGLRVLEHRTAELADGRVLRLEVVGPVEVRFQNRQTTCRAMVLPGKSEVLLGAIPMEDMDVLIDPRKQRLIVNPEHPNISQMAMKGFRHGHLD